MTCDRAGRFAYGTSKPTSKRRGNTEFWVTSTRLVPHTPLAEMWRVGSHGAGGGGGGRTSF